MTSEALKRFRARAKERQSGFERDYAIFPFWNLPVGGSTTIRLIPFQDALTGDFWTEKKIIRMQFVDPNDESKVIRFEAPCYEMYQRDHKCPILQPVRDLYDEAKQLENAGDTQESERIKKVAGSHWIKPVFNYQGFVIKPGMTEQNTPDNPIRIFPLLKKTHLAIHSKLMSEEEDGFDILPTGDFTVEEVKSLLSGELGEEEMDALAGGFEGINFILKKTKQGEYANYDTSSWATGHSTLTDEQLEAISNYGIHDLRARLPKQPTEEQYDLMTEMVNISINRLLGEDDGYWDPDWEKAGLTPKKARNDSEGGSDDKPVARRSGANAGKLKNQLSKAKSGGNGVDNEPAADANVSSVLDRARKQRGVKADAPEDAPATPDADSKGEAVPPKAALAARVRAGLKK